MIIQLGELTVELIDKNSSLFSNHNIWTVPQWHANKGSCSDEAGMESRGFAKVVIWIAEAIVAAASLELTLLLQTIGS